MQDLEEMAEAEVDLGDMNFAALNTLRERIDEKVREMREVGGPALLAKLAEEAGEIGMTVEEVVALGGKRRGRPAKDKAED
jgi:L-lactate utilization protein LutB